MNKAYNDLKRGFNLYKVWLYQAYHELSSKYRHTALGSFWIAGSMISTSICLSLVFGVIQGQNLNVVLPYIMGGILVYTMLGFVLVEGNEVFLGAAGIIKNHAYPFTYYVFESVTRSFLTFCHNLIVFYIALFCVGYFHVPNWSFILGIPIVLVTMWTWGTVAGLAAARFRDLRFMLPYVSQLVFFITPVFWQPGPHAQGWRAAIVNFNPFYGLLEVVREPLLGKAPAANCWVLAFIAMFSGIAAWAIFFPLLRRRIPFWV